MDGHTSISSRFRSAPCCRLHNTNPGANAVGIASADKRDGEAERIYRDGRAHLRSD
jgi:hypothetical protein